MLPAFLLLAILSASSLGEDAHHPEITSSYPHTTSAIEKNIQTSRELVVNSDLPFGENLEENVVENSGGPTEIWNPIGQSDIRNVATGQSAKLSTHNAPMSAELSEDASTPKVQSSTSNIQSSISSESSLNPLTDQLILMREKKALQARAVMKQKFSSTTDKPEKEEMTIEEHWQKTERGFRKILGHGFKAMMPMVLRLVYSQEISPSCLSGLVRTARALGKFEKWAIELMDSTGKLPEGLMSGTLSAMGSFDQCLKIEARPAKDQGPLWFRGQYCMVEVKPYLPPKPRFYRMDGTIDSLKNISTKSTMMKSAARFAHMFYFLAYKTGVCLPSTCSLKDVENLAKSVANELHLQSSVSYCEVQGPKEYELHQVIIISVFGVVALLMLAGTLLEALRGPQENVESSPGFKAIGCFSLLTNLRKLMDTRDNGGANLRPLHGLKFLSICWVILGHTYLNINFQLFRGLSWVSSLAHDLAFQSVLNATVAVDTFFFISGFLVSYVVYQKFILKNQRINIPLVLFHRFWRLTPSYAAVLGIVMLTPLLSSGPLWKESLGFMSDNCRDNWWTHLTYLNNIVNTNRQCIYETWYLASDTQLFVLGIVVLFIGQKFKRSGLVLMLSMIPLSMFIVGAITYLLDLPPAMLFTNPDPDQRNEYLSILYYKPYSHMGPYAIGMLAGSYFVRHPDHTIRSKILQCIGWILSTAACLTMLFGVYEWNRGDLPPPLISGAYACSHRVIWTLGIAWVAMACLGGYGGYVNVFLSWRGFLPLSRLTFLAYLIHPIVQRVFIGNFREQMHTGHMVAVWGYFGHLCVSLSCALVLSMGFEAPSIALERIFLRNNPKIINEEKKKPALQKTSSDSQPKTDSFVVKL